MSDRRVFLKYVIPAVLSFALSGVYSIVDGFFVGNRDRHGRCGVLFDLYGGKERKACA